MPDAQAVASDPFNLNVGPTARAGRHRPVISICDEEISTIARQQRRAGRKEGHLSTEGCSGSQLRVNTIALSSAPGDSVSERTELLQSADEAPKPPALSAKAQGERAVMVRDLGIEDS
jgi:hypothetical protein